ncbi:TonB-dependent receptor domain-containing protein [Roseococcus pinisoli]|uniref:TonB-dependent receptor n=1 Tax=Roseococcus pinisoli TaxID=2835040 RepID=A0ABS5QH70_9PROT|nr:TonB-dependent receptor [Roseococcus pinisoli]MBS7812833.1 TonB-dependent receptor [Roseococcus pinisoli]
MAQPAPAVDPSNLQLPTVHVQTTPDDAAFETPAGVSTVTPDSLRMGGDTNRLLDTVPGVALGGYASQPGVAVNMRGMEGFGRVNMMVEGVRQNFRPAGHEGGSFAYVDPNFISGIDVERGAVTGRGGMGALVGAVNFRLLDVEDILRPGQNIGGRLQGMTGSNGYQWNTSVVTAARLGNGISVLGGFSGRENSQFKNGDGQIVPNTEQSQRSGLFRMNWQPNEEHRISLTGNVYENRFTSNFYDQNIQSNLVQLSYRYRPVANPLVDLDTAVSWNQIRMNNYLTEAGKFSATATGRRIVNNAIQGHISNTSRFALGGSVNVNWEYGLQYATDDTKTRRGGVNGDGTLNLFGAYSRATFTRGILSFTQGLRYDHYSLDGQGFANPALGPVPVTGAYNANNSQGRVSPRFTLAVQALDWLQPYVSYGWAFRPPTIAETMYSGPHSAGGASTFYPNPYLRPETSQGWEIGANVLRRNVIQEGDRVRLKLAYFDNDVNDLINMVSIRGTANNRAYSYSFYNNVPGKSRLRGVELEGGYDMGVAYINLTYTNTSIRYADGADHSFLPRNNLMVDAGVRLLDRRLTLGGRVRAIGNTQSLTSTGVTSAIPSYTTVDLYASYRPIDRLTLFVNATNIGNTVYTVPAAETIGGGRGATVIGGATLTF